MARVLELYVAGDNLNSRRAQANLEEIVKQLDELITVTVFDVTKSPRAAFERQIFATPSLVSISNEKKTLIIGDLGDLDSVVRRLRESR